MVGIVIVDVTATGVANPVPTALGAQYAGATQAAVLGTMFNGTNIQRPDWAPTAELVALVVGGLLLILLSRWMLIGLATTVILIGGVVPYSIYTYATEKMLLDVTAPVIVFIIVALQVYGIKFLEYTGTSRNVVIDNIQSQINLNSFSYMSEGWNETNISLSAITREEYLFGITTPPEVQSDVYVDRGKTSVLDMHLRLSEIKDLGELSRYGNGFYKLKRE